MPDDKSSLPRIPLCYKCARQIVREVDEEHRLHPTLAKEIVGCKDLANQEWKDGGYKSNCPLIKESVESTQLAQPFVCTDRAEQGEQKMATKIPFTPTETLLIGYLIHVRKPATAQAITGALQKKNVGPVVKLLKKLMDRGFVTMSIRTKAEDLYTFNWDVLGDALRYKNMLSNINAQIDKVLG